MSPGKVPHGRPRDASSLVPHYKQRAGFIKSEFLHDESGSTGPPDLKCKLKEAAPMPKAKQLTVSCDTGTLAHVARVLGGIVTALTRNPHRRRSY